MVKYQIKICVKYLLSGIKSTLSLAPDWREALKTANFGICEGRLTQISITATNHT